MYDCVEDFCLWGQTWIEGPTWLRADLFISSFILFRFLLKTTQNLCSRVYFCLFFYFTEVLECSVRKVQHRPEADFGLLAFCMQNHVKIYWMLYKLEHCRICITDSIAGNHNENYSYSERWMKDSISPLLLCLILALRLCTLLTIMFGSLGEHIQQIAAK